MHRTHEAHWCFWLWKHLSLRQMQVNLDHKKINNRELDMSDECTEEKFLKDVAGHEMTIIREDGVLRPYRHIRFARPDTINMSFELITWPGSLCYIGDMGTYVFSRTNDMFQFFRSSRDVHMPEGRTLYINTGYWAEKCEAIDSRDGISEYSPEKFIETIREWLDDREASPEVRAEAEENIISFAEEGEHAARQAVSDFDCDGFEFSDFWEANLHVRTYRYIWACYAIAWAIKTYDAAKAAKGNG